MGEIEGKTSSIVGTILGGKYHVRRIIGSGGMGIVCEAEHVGLGKRLAIKVIDSSLAQHVEVTTRFRREARAASASASEHIAQVYDVDVDPTRGLYLVMELLEGEDLAARIARDGRIDADSVVRIAQQTLRGLERAHAARIVHRDLKPANIFLTRRDGGEPLVKLLDFGVSKLLEGEGRCGSWDDAITERGLLVGTPQYMSPEQAMGHDEIDHRTDIWSLGAVLYEALAGVPLFDEMPRFHQTLLNVMQKTPRPLLQVAPGVPPRLAAVIDAALVRDRNQRIQDCQTFSRLLRESHPSVAEDGTLERSAVIVMANGELTVDGEDDTLLIPASARSVAGVSPPAASLTLPAEAPFRAPLARVVSDSPTVSTLGHREPRPAAIAAAREPRRPYAVWWLAAVAAVATAFFAGRASVPRDRELPRSFAAPGPIDEPTELPAISTATPASTGAPTGSSAPPALSSSAQAPVFRRR